MSKKTIIKSSKKRLLVCEAGERSFNLSKNNTTTSENDIFPGSTVNKQVPRVYSISLWDSAEPIKKKKKSNKASTTITSKESKYKGSIKTKKQTKSNEQGSTVKPVKNVENKNCKNKIYNGTAKQNKFKETIFSQEKIDTDSEEPTEINLYRTNGIMPLKPKPVLSKPKDIFASCLEDEPSLWDTSSCLSQAYDNLDMIVSQGPISYDNTASKDTSKSRACQLNKTEYRNNYGKTGKRTCIGSRTEIMNNTVNSKKPHQKPHQKRNQLDNSDKVVKNTTNKYDNSKQTQNEEVNNVKKKPTFKLSKNKSNSNNENKLKNNKMKNNNNNKLKNNDNNNNNINKLKNNNNNKINKLKNNNQSKSETSSDCSKTNSSSNANKIHNKPQMERSTSKYCPKFSVKKNIKNKTGIVSNPRDSVTKLENVNKNKKIAKPIYNKTSEVPDSQIPCTFQEQEIPMNIFSYDDSSPPQRKKKVPRKRVNRKTNSKATKQKKAAELVLSLIIKIKEEIQTLKEKRHKGS